MKILHKLVIFVITASGCVNSEQQEVTFQTEKKVDHVDTLFQHVVDFPSINDTSTFISDLRHIFNLPDDHDSSQLSRITAYQKVRIFGSEKELIFVEYDLVDGPGAAFPWKYQLLLTMEGKPIKALSCQRVEFVQIFENEAPFLLSVVGTSKGNGNHELYRIEADTLQNVLKGYSQQAEKTFDAHQDHSIYEPNELIYNVEDINNDGYNDLSFVGMMVLIQGRTAQGDWYDSQTMDGKSITYSVENPFKKIPVEFVFQFNQASGYFIAAENYAEKYELESY